MKAVLLLAGCFACLGAQAQRRGVYRDIATALQQPDKVRVLDLRGQGLDSLPSSLNSLQNVEAILMGMKVRNLWLYPRAWKYKFHLSRLPAGGYLHLQGRGRGEYFTFNNFETAPLDFCRFPHLRVLDVAGGVPFVTADTIATRMARCRPQVIVLGGTIHRQAPTADVNDPFAATRMNIDKWDGARDYLRRFKIKQW